MMRQTARKKLWWIDEDDYDIDYDDGDDDDHEDYTINDKATILSWVLVIPDIMISLEHIFNPKGSYLPQGKH